MRARRQSFQPMIKWYDMAAQVYDPRKCTLGEGPLWHPLRKELFWFDILNKQLMCKERHWQFEEYVSAAGWIDQDHLLIASESALSKFDLRSGQSEHIVALEADNPKTRSNDGRADPFGGFWIGTMGKALEPSLGSICRFYRGELKKLYGEITISNAICFSPDKKQAYFTDTPTQKIMSQALDHEGWPLGEPVVLIDLSGDNLNPDGAVVDEAGCLWIAQWGANRVAKYSPAGGFLLAVDLPASQITCPAFGLEGDTLFVTSAADGISEPHGGQTFSIQVDAIGQKEHQVIL